MNESNLFLPIQSRGSARGSRVGETETAVLSAVYPSGCAQHIYPCYTHRDGTVGFCSETICSEIFPDGYIYVS
jgi:hypothetical protein